MDVFALAYGVFPEGYGYFTSNGRQTYGLVK